MYAVHTSDNRHFKKLWREHGGFIFNVSGTGEVRYVHPAFVAGVKVNCRRKDVPAKLLSRLNSIIRSEAANEPQLNLGG